MMKGKQSQESGHESTQIQAQGDVHYHGLNYEDAREVALSVYKENFIQLKDAAAEIATQRVEDFIDSFIDEAKRRGFQDIPEGRNPDFQYVLYLAQKGYARRGDKDSGDLLVKLLADRAGRTERNLIQIVLNESIEVAPKLTTSQLAALSTMFLVSHTVKNGFTDLASFVVHVNDLIVKFSSQASTSEADYPHLHYSGCGSLSNVATTVEAAFSNGYPGLFCTGFTEEEVQGIDLNLEEIQGIIKPCLYDDSLLQVEGAINREIDEAGQRQNIAQQKVVRLKQLQNGKLMSQEQVRGHLLEVEPNLKQSLFDLWDHTLMKHTMLTSVGTAIAHANVKRVTGDFADLSIWIH
jgi:hypothetical protein